jgi:hypothetical protein
MQCGQWRKQAEDPKKHRPGALFPIRCQAHKNIPQNRNGSPEISLRQSAQQKPNGHQGFNNARASAGEYRKAQEEFSCLSQNSQLP